MPILLSIKPANFRLIQTASQRAQQSIRGEMDRAARKARDEFKKTTTTWDTKPDFKIEVTPATRKIRVSSQVWHWVDAGTKPHTITRRGLATKKGKLSVRRVANAQSQGKLQYLQFRTGYQAKSIPGIPDSFAGGTYTGGFVKKLSVEHPGIKARRFTEVIRGIIEDDLNRTIENAINRALGKIF